MAKDKDGKPLPRNTAVKYLGKRDRKQQDRKNHLEYLDRKEKANASK